MHLSCNACYYLQLRLIMGVGGDVLITHTHWYSSSYFFLQNIHYLYFTHAYLSTHLITHITRDATEYE